jgi:hypothetical protein
MAAPPTLAQAIAARLYRVTTPGTATVPGHPATYFHAGQIVDASVWDPTELAADGVIAAQMIAE